MAEAIDGATLPADIPLALAMESVAAIVLLQGDRPAMRQEWRLAAARRTVPPFAGKVTQSASTFELLTWTLLDQPAPSEGCGNGSGILPSVPSVPMLPVSTQANRARVPIGFVATPQSESR